MNESETLNHYFTIILAVHQPYSIMLHVTYVYIMQADLQPRKGLKPCFTFYPTYDWELAFHIYRERVHWFQSLGIGTLAESINWLINHLIRLFSELHHVNLSL